MFSSRFLTEHDDANSLGSIWSHSRLCEMCLPRHHCEAKNVNGTVIYYTFSLVCHNNNDGNEAVELKYL